MMLQDTKRSHASRLGVQCPVLTPCMRTTHIGITSEAIMAMVAHCLRTWKKKPGPAMHADTDSARATSVVRLPGQLVQGCLWLPELKVPIPQAVAVPSLDMPHPG